MSTDATAIIRIKPSTVKRLRKAYDAAHVNITFEVWLRDLLLDHVRAVVKEVEGC